MATTIRLLGSGAPIRRVATGLATWHAGCTSHWASALEKGLAMDVITLSLTAVLLGSGIGLIALCSRLRAGERS